jgi:hypothetical protein
VAPAGTLTVVVAVVEVVVPPVETAAPPPVVQETISRPRRADQVSAPAMAEMRERIMSPLA